MMELFGWIVIVLISCFVTFATAFGGYFQLALSDKIDKSILIPIAACVALWYTVVVNCPFTLTVN